MRMLTKAANDMREINNFVNEQHIKKEDIINIFQTMDGIFLLVYYAE